MSEQVKDFFFLFLFQFLIEQSLIIDCVPKHVMRTSTLYTIKHMKIFAQSEEHRKKKKIIGKCIIVSFMRKLKKKCLKT